MQTLVRKVKSQGKSQKALGSDPTKGVHLMSNIEAQAHLKTLTIISRRIFLPLFPLVDDCILIVWYFSRLLPRS